MLMLSYVALRRNDQVGLMRFSDRICAFVPPAGGPGETNRLVPADAPAATKSGFRTPSANRGLTTRQFYTAAAAADIITWRHRVLADLEKSGALSLDVFPEDLSASLVNRYLDIKARHLL